MNVLQIFLFGFLFSSLGAVPPGLINLSVAERSISRGARAGVMVALGAGLTQFIYAFIAVYFIDSIIKNEIITATIQYIAMIIFFLLGIYYLFKKGKPITSSRSSSDTKHFGYGLAIAGMNMLIIPTWIFIAVWLKGNGFDFTHLREIFSISLGAGIGALLIFLGYVRLSRFILARMSKVIKYTNLFLGVIFIALSVFQLLRILAAR